MAEEALPEESEDRKEAEQLICTYIAAEASGIADAIETRYLALPPVVLLLVGEALRNRRFKDFAIGAMTPDEFLEVGIRDWTVEDMDQFWRILRRGVPDEPIRLFGLEFPLSDVIIITRDGVQLYARHMVLCRASRKIGKMIRLSDKGIKYLELPKDANGVREVLYLLHTPSPTYDTTYSAEQIEYLQNFAEEYEVPRLQELLAIEHLSLDFQRMRGPEDVVVLGKSERADLAEEDRNYQLYADYDVLCRSSTQLANQMYEYQGQRCIDMHHDRLFALVVLKILHDSRCTAADLDLNADVLGRLHKYALALGMSRVLHLIESRLRLKPNSEILAMLVRNTSASRSVTVESLKVSVIETMPIAELKKYLDTHGRDFHKGVRNFTALMAETCRRRFEDEDVYYDWDSLTPTERKECRSPAYRNHISRRDLVCNARP